MLKQPRGRNPLCDNARDFYGNLNLKAVPPQLKYPPLPVKSWSAQFLRHPARDAQTTTRIRLRIDCSLRARSVNLYYPSAFRCAPRGREPPKGRSTQNLCCNTALPRQFPQQCTSVLGLLLPRGFLMFPLSRAVVSRIVVRWVGLVSPPLSGET